MATDFNADLTDVRTHEAKLTVSSGRMAQFAYDSTAYQDDTAEGTATYNFGNHQNIPLGNAGTLNIDGQVLDKGVRSQASSITRMMLNHFFGRASYNVNKMADYMKAILDTLLSFMREGSNAWSPTTSYVAGDLVYYVHTINGVSTKRTFFCKEASTNKPPVDSTTGALINTSYWGEINVGNTTINGDLNVNGNIYQNGSAYETHAEKIFTKKDMIYTREGAVAGLVTNALTGITGLLYDGVHNGVLGFDNLGTARVGDEGDEQPLLTRAESNALANEHMLVWDATNKKAVDGGKLLDITYTKEQVNAVAEDRGAYWGNPVGTLITFYGNTAPAHYLACNGTAFDTARYPKLFAHLGSNILPDFQECAIVGIGTNITNPMGAHDVFTNAGDFKDDCLQEHRHTSPLTPGQVQPGSYNSVFVIGSSTSYVTTVSDARVGSVTRGKRKGALICIRAE